MDLNKFTSEAPQIKNIPIVEPTDEETGQSDEALLLRYDRPVEHISFK